jgi:hypothetical protein
MDKHRAVMWYHTARNLFRTIYSESIRIAWIKRSTQVLRVAPVQTVTNTEKYTKTQWYRTTLGDIQVARNDIIDQSASLF